MNIASTLRHSPVFTGRLPTVGFLASACAAGLGSLFLLAASPVMQGWALWSLVALGCGWVLQDAWREQRQG